MALQLTLADPATGAVYPTAYHRVNGLSIDTLNKRVIVHTAVYLDKASRDAGKSPVAVPNVVSEGGADYAALVAQDGTATIGLNPVQRAYKWLKAREQYAGALDV